TSGIAFVLLLLIALNILRPFKLREWVLFGIGFTLLLYFYVAYLFLTDNINNIATLFSVGFDFKAEYNNLTVFLVGMGLIVMAIVWGIFYLQNFMSRMVIKTKKYWSIVIIFMVTSLLTILFSDTKDTLNNWILIVPSVALIAANGF